MSTPTATRPVIEIAPDVEAHVRAKRVEAVYRHTLESVPRLFPTFTRLTVTLEPDPEIEDYTFISFELHVPKEDVPDYRGATKRWLRDHIAAYPGGGEPFVLSLFREGE
jgi:hypothetical protein